MKGYSSFALFSDTFMFTGSSTLFLRWLFSCYFLNLSELFFYIVTLLYSCSTIGRDTSKDLILVLKIQYLY